MASVTGVTQELRTFVTYLEEEFSTVTGAISPLTLLQDVFKALELSTTNGAAGTSRAITGNDTVNNSYGTMTVNVSVGGSALISAVDQFGYPTTAKLNFINASTKGSTIFGSVGSDTLSGGSSSSSLSEGRMAGNNVIISSRGNTTIFSGENENLISVVGAGNVRITAASGNETLSALTASGNDTFYASVGHATVLATTVAGAVDTFAFVKEQTAATSMETIFDFKRIDVISLSGYGQTAPSVTGGSGGASLLTLSDGTKITVYGAIPTKIINNL